MQTANLFQPGKIGTMEVKNRLVMAPMGHCSADNEGYPTSRTIEYFVERAKGGVGLIIIGGGLRILPEARLLGALSGYDDRFIPRLRELSQAIHEYGAKVAIQVAHGGTTLSEMRLASDHPEEIDVIGPSPVPWVRNNFVPREAGKKDIDRLIENFSEAARRARDAGFDAVEFHGAHGYLISSFLSPFTNRRTDEYGGNPEDRARFPCEIIRLTREKVGADFPIGLRISGADYIRGGITLEDTLRQAPLFVEAGADVLHVSASSLETCEWQILSYLWPDAAIVNLAEAVKKVVNVPVITVGKIGDPVLADRILKERKADFIAMGRALLADPELPNKAKEGRFDDIRRCIYCNNCWGKPRQQKLKFGGIFCTINPALLREVSFTLKATASPKKAMVVGGGLAGMEAARVLAQRGHRVSLYERSDELGGQWNIASRQRLKKMYATVTERMVRGLYEAGVKVTLNKEVTARFVREVQPDVVVVATGAIPKILDVPGAMGENVVQANDVIMGKAKADNRVVVIGGRLVGMEVADLLAEEGSVVSIVTLHKLGENGRAIERNLYRTLRNRLIDHGVFIYPDSSVLEIRANGVNLANNHELLFLKADTVVLAVGARSENELVKELRDMALEVYTIGDCVEPRDAMEAVKEGAEVGRLI